MTSILKVDNLQDANGTGTPYIKDAVLQVRQGVQATPFTISTSETDIMSVQITPKSTSS